MRRPRWDFRRAIGGTHHVHIATANVAMTVTPERPNLANGLASVGGVW